jgi:hypothetical protein
MKTVAGLARFVVCGVPAPISELSSPLVPQNSRYLRGPNAPDGHHRYAGENKSAGQLDAARRLVMIPAVLAAKKCGWCYWTGVLAALKRVEALN